jgi:hypothetical protein
LSTAEPDLRTLQHWIHAFITRTGEPPFLAGARHGERLPASSAGVEQVITRSSSLSAYDRLAIYRHAYLARLQDCLRIEYPVLLLTLGEELFALFTNAYLQQYPSRSYTLNRLGENFPRYLADSRPDAAAPESARESWPDLIVELATFERAFAEVFDGEGNEGKPLADRARLLALPPEALLRARFKTVAGFRIFSFRYPIAGYFKAARNKEKPELPQPCRSYVALMRRDYVVRVHELAEIQYALLSGVSAGRTLHEIAAEEKGADRFVTNARKWLGEWTAKGLFAAIELPPGDSP